MCRRPICSAAAVPLLHGCHPWFGIDVVASVDAADMGEPPVPLSASHRLHLGFLCSSPAHRATAPPPRFVVALLPEVDRVVVIPAYCLPPVSIHSVVPDASVLTAELPSTLSLRSPRRPPSSSLPLCILVFAVA
ncbi:hypothetical protein E2562_032819 [Oryza meyeriana var. granulata]|uniref:Uncharacterized protein n=1 Tax=Oryza meyeriana var. granulata TaxID=110450 RepID=A0A6G1DS24_9ORYZ|nr:hypothetical protein E2562_032819 [Oryza meyeriana var. granulata]